MSADRPWMGERAERLERPLLIAAVLVIPELILEQSRVGPGWKALAAALNRITWLAFVFELAAMLAVVRNRRQYLVHSAFNVAIIVLTPPLAPPFLQSLRVLRLLWLLRLAPIFRRAFTLRGFAYTTALAGLVVVTRAAAFSSIQPGINYFNALSGW